MEYIFSDKISGLKPSAIREIFKSLTNPDIIAFAAGNPASESFPVKELAALSADIFENDSVRALQYGMTEGHPPLRSAVTQRMNQKFGIGRDFDETIIVSGGQQGIELACKVFCNEGDVVVCENPSFIGALNAFRSCGAKTVGVPIEDDGINIEKLKETLDKTERVKMLYLIPTFQNPTGICTSEEKRRAIYEIARERNIVIFEDNPYGELRFAGEDIKTLKSMDDDGIVIYCSSFSKILSAGMRVGYVSAHSDIIKKMTVAKQSEDVHTNMFFQLLCFKFMTECDLDAQIEKIKALYLRKCNLMLDALDKHMPKDITFTRPEGGLFVWCALPDRIDLMTFVRDALSRNVAVVPGSTFMCDPAEVSNAFRLNFSTPTDEQIVRGIQILGDLAGEYRGY